MPALRQSQVKKVEDVLALCCADDGDMARFDRAVVELDANERELALRQIGRQLRQTEERRRKLQEVGSALEQLSAVAGYRAVVLAPPAGKGASANGSGVHVALLGQQTQLTVGVLPDVPDRDFALGEEVEVVQTGPQHYAIRRRLGPHVRHGAVARVEEILSPDLLRVHRGPETVILRAAASAAAEVRRHADGDESLLGRLVSFDEQLGLAFTFFGPPERDTLTLREFPAVQRADLILAPRTGQLLEDQIILPLRYPDLARAAGVEMGRFFIFDGPAGVGKTHAARWLATELGRPLYLINGGELASKWYGDTDLELRRRIEAAKHEPGGAVIVWDEAESMLVERGRSVVGVEDRLVSLMLTASDGFTHRGDVLFILTTNRSDMIDVAIKRPLRATTVTFERPDAPRTRALFRLYLDRAACAGDDREALAQAGTLAIFAEREPIAEAVLRDGSRLPLTRAMAVSGALVRSSCQAALRAAFVYQARHDGSAAPNGVGRHDLLAALDEEFARLAHTLTVSSLGQAVRLAPGVAEQVVAIHANDTSGRQHHLAEA